MKTARPVEEPREERGQMDSRDVEVDFAVFLQSRDPYSFGHPSIEAISNCFLKVIATKSSDYSHTIIEAHYKISIVELNHNYNNDLLHQKHQKMLKRLTNEEECEDCGIAFIHGLNVEELQLLKTSARTCIIHKGCVCLMR
ncbi:hypothetical protein JRO89_XS06G0232500 [Xanthoceras sorbifolium]|uniref:Uncharacterized protein n=1 Tax=Xanthoceras sorbifolium TaxID=99658 RepID=A0ABQ8HZ71_9ROSI|nr:hypothetical protein JRO89_XS06G0232500 [Xanthoceras sorbifolium]